MLLLIHSATKRPKSKACTPSRRTVQRPVHRLSGTSSLPFPSQQPPPSPSPSKLRLLSGTVHPGSIRLRAAEAHVSLRCSLSVVGPGFWLVALTLPTSLCSALLAMVSLHTILFCDATSDMNVGHLQFDSYCQLSDIS